jgi:hypothetical protein
MRVKRDVAMDANGSGTQLDNEIKRCDNAGCTPSKFQQQIWPE